MGICTLPSGTLWVVSVSVSLVPGIQLTGVPHTFIELQKNLVHSGPNAGIASMACELWGLCVI